MTRPTWTIHPKGAPDVEPTVALLADVAREGSWIATEWPFDVSARARALRAALLSRSVLGWVAYDGRAAVGDLSIFDPAEPEPVLGMVVAASHRRRGIGRALIESAAAWGRDNGKAALRLRVFPDNAAALALYRATGFVDVALQRRSIPRSDGTLLDALLMRRPLAP